LTALEFDTENSTEQLKMKQIILILILCHSFFSTVKAEDYSDCFFPGEVTKYKIYWMGIPLAWSQTTTDSIVKDGKKLIRITVITQNYIPVYPVDDRTVILIDPQTALPVSVDVIQNEGSVHQKTITTFFHDKKVAIFQNKITKTIKEVPIQETTKDLYSFIYSIRKHKLKDLNGKKYKILVDGKMYQLGFKVHREQKVPVPGHGNVLCTTIEPIAKFDGIFIRKGKILFWVSKANPHIITYAKTKVAIGKIIIQLQSVSGPGKDFWIKKKK